MTRTVLQPTKATRSRGALSLFDEYPNVPQRRTARLRYIGSKARFANQILEIVGAPERGGQVFVDMFSGMGTVAREAAKSGWSVKANDHLLSSATMTKAQLLAFSDVPFARLGGYEAALQQLNKVVGIEGFFYREYAPSGCSRSGDSRKYFTPENAARLDGIRKQIATWFSQSKITQTENDLLIADLMSAANAVANIAGTYGCFLSRWNPSALQSIKLASRSFIDSPCDYVVTCSDVFNVKTDIGDVVYLDPPYTKRQYAAYYHLLETIAFGDEPEVVGVTGLRPWEQKSSPFCYKTKALDALERLITEINSRKIILSYSSEGHISIKPLLEMLKKFGTVDVYEVPEVGRYRPNIKASQTASAVTEFVITLVKPEVQI